MAHFATGWSVTKKVHMYIIQLTLIEIYLESIFFSMLTRGNAEEFRKIAIFFRRDFREVFSIILSPISHRSALLHTHA